MLVTGTTWRCDNGVTTTYHPKSRDQQGLGGTTIDAAWAELDQRAQDMVKALMCSSH